MQTVLGVWKGPESQVCTESLYAPIPAQTHTGNSPLPLESTWEQTAVANQALLFNNQPCNQHSYHDLCVIFMCIWSQQVKKIQFLWYFAWASFKLLCSRSCQPNAGKKYNTLEAFVIFKSIESNDNFSPMRRKKSSHQLVKVSSFLW